ncbi:MAG: hypothetical protein IH944_01650 [Armatimonadetes bacterium]|nr:hypothetical protein [Armatimonadota bacterium]
MSSSTTAAPPGYRALRESVAKVRLPGMAHVLLAGTDAVAWLQGQTTNDVADLSPDHAVDFCLIEPTGQLRAICRAWRVPEGVIIGTQSPELIEQRVERFVIMEDVEASRVGEQTVCLQGPQAEAVGGRWALPSDRTGSGGWEIIGPAASPDAPELSEEGYELATLEAGIPLFGVDTSPKTLPPELGAAFVSSYVSYQKGCYVGQEVLMRIYSRGHTNKTWVGLKLESDVDRGTSVLHDGKDVGKVHRTALSPTHGWIASATLRNQATTPGTRVAIADTSAEVVEMPFDR